jgi:hypothetical protein
MKATSRLSAPSSSGIATIPLAPPAMSPSVPVAWLIPVRRAIAIPTPSESASVASVTAETPNQFDATARSVDASSSVPSATPMSAWPIVMPLEGTSSGRRTAIIA